jgi:hypothetical protein
MSEERAKATNERKGRAIHMTDTRDHFILGLTEQPLNDAWKEKVYPISVGRGWFYADAVDFVRRLEKKGVVYCFDAEKFDSSLMPWLIHIAMTIMRMQFEEGLEHRYDNYWLFVEESLLHSFVFRDDGVIFEKYIGTSSGHNHNSLAQSICTLLMAAFNVFYVNRTIPAPIVGQLFYAESLGDDNITSESDELTHESVEDRADRTWAVFQINWGGSKSFSTSELLQGFVKDESWKEEEMYETAQYLGKYFRAFFVAGAGGGEVRTVLPYRPLKESVLRLLYPEGLRESVGESEPRDMHGDMRGARVAGHMLDGYGNPDTRGWIAGFMDFCSWSGYECKLEGSKKMQERFERLRATAPELGVSFVQFSFSHWLGLVVAQKNGEVIGL